MLNGKITTGQILKYSALPGLRPRLKDLFFSGFAHIPLFIASVFYAVRLLPAGHPYLNDRNLGQFGIRHVIAETANNLVLSRKHIDQILVFILVLLALFLVFAQIGLLLLGLFFQPALADNLPQGISGFFSITPEQAEQDLAYMFMDLVFGVPDVFDSCVSVGGQCRDVSGDIMADSSGAWILSGLGFPYPIHVGLHQMFQIYNIGLLVIAAMITFYFIAVVVAETAQSGTPFGQRFNKFWAPLRIVIAFGLLVPVSYGMNSAQYVVLYAAKFGSAFATNGWLLFNETMSERYLDDARTLISRPNIPEVGGLLQFMYVAKTCQQAHDVYNGVSDSADSTIKPYLVSDLVSSTARMEVEYFTDYETMVNFANGDNIVLIRFGEKGQEALGLGQTQMVNYGSYKGGVNPTCGELAFRLMDPRMPGSSNPPDKGIEVMQRYYWYLIQELWYVTLEGNTPMWEPIRNFSGQNFPRQTALSIAPWDPDPNAQKPPSNYKSALQEFYSRDLEAAMTDPGSTNLQGMLNSTKGALEEQMESGRWIVDDNLRAKGWAGAGIWYNRIADLNGSVTTAIFSMPAISRYPYVMEYVREQKRQQDENIDVSRRFEPVLGNGKAIWPAKSEDGVYATILWEAFKYWEIEDHVSTSHSDETGNAFIDVIHAIFGTEGLFNLRKNEQVHPLARLVGVGNSLIQSVVINMGAATGGAVAGAVLSRIWEQAGALASVLIGFSVMIASIALTVGFLLSYVIPFLPFIYFFFAVSGWIKGIFEAMAGVSLWALAHIRIDGEGLGSAAKNGYLLIFEIFLRPILIVFGLLGSVLVFAAVVDTLDEIWDVVTNNLTGFDIRAELTRDGAEPSTLQKMRGAVDEFFFTIVYTIVVYLVGVSCFKMIDTIPNNILRFMGENIQTFNDAREDPAQGLVAKVGIGTQQIVDRQIGTGVKGALQGVATMGSKRGGG